MRFSLKDLGDRERCQEGVESCAPWAPMEYCVSYSLNGIVQAEDIKGRMYFISMASLGPGTYTVSVTISDVNRNPLYFNRTVEFTIDESVEYEGDGAAPEVRAPCLAAQGEDKDGVCHTGKKPCSAVALSCGDHGRLDSSELCICDPDWIGKECEYHILSGTRYLPPEDPSTAPQRCGQARDLLETFERARAMADGLQHSRDACRGGVSVVRVRGTNGHAGMASFIEQVRRGGASCSVTRYKLTTACSASSVGLVCVRCRQYLRTHPGGRPAFV